MDVWYVTLDAMRSREPAADGAAPGLPRRVAGPCTGPTSMPGGSSGFAGRTRAGCPGADMGRDRRGAPGRAGVDPRAPRRRPAFGVLNLCRLLYSYEMRDPVTGKAQAAIWAHAVLPVEHHALIRSALASYADRTYRTDGDVDAFFQDMERWIAGARGVVTGPS